MRWCLVLAGAALVAAPASAQPALDPLQQADAAIQTVGWRLAHANAPFCAHSAAGAGVLLGDAATFTDPAAVHASWHLTGDVMIAAVAADSPAERAGLAPDQTVIAVVGAAVADIPAPTSAPWQRVFALQDRLDAALAREGHATLTLGDGRMITLTGEPACAVHFLLDDSHGNASANTRTVRIGRTLAEHLHWREDWIAALVAHELAHAVLDHAAWRAAAPGLATERATEHEADRLAVWLLANAGYDPAAVIPMLRHLGPTLGWLTPDLAHGSTTSRIRRVADELTRLPATRPVDWARQFTREPGAPAMPPPAR